MTIASSFLDRKPLSLLIAFVNFRILIPSKYPLNFCPIKAAFSYSLSTAFPSKLKTLVFNKSYPDSFSSPYLPPVSTQNTIQNTVWLSTCPTPWIFDPLPIDFLLDKRMWISWFPWLRLCGHCRNLEFTIRNTITILRQAFDTKALKIH